MMTTRVRLTLVAALSAVLAACGGGDPQAEPEAAETPAESAPSESAPEPGQDNAENTGPDLIDAPEGSLADGAMVIGSDDAVLTLVEYASVTCPGCRLFHENTFPRIKSDFVDTGLVRFEYRELPTPPERFAFAGFILARCAATDAGPQGYLAMIDALYRRQNDWVRGPNAAQELRNIAAQAGIDDQGFEDCFRRRDIREAIASNVDTARSTGVRGTPTFFIDGKEFDMPFDPDEAAEKLQAEVEKRR